MKTRVELDWDSGLKEASRRSIVSRSERVDQLQLVPRRRGFHRLIFGYFRMGKSSGGGPRVGLGKSAAFVETAARLRADWSKYTET